MSKYSDKETEAVNKNLSLLAKSSVIVFGGLFLSKVFTYLYRIIIARYYGPEVYGVFALAVMIVTLFVAFSSMGFGNGLIRFISFYRSKKILEE